jgi:peptidoglycan hydrolase-like protein with peptidoglycan-binding domain
MSTTAMRIILLIALLAFTAVVRADDNIASVQQMLKEQGFYYGEINGQKNADTTAAIRRYQIRSGLPVTGELNDETLRSLRSAPAATPKPVAAPTAAPPAPGPSPESSDLRDEAPREPAETGAPPPEPYDAEPPPDRPSGEPVRPGPVLPSGGRLFGGTPYETAPPEVQRRVIVDAQKILARRGLYRNPIDGSYGPDFEFSLRAYQSRVGLPATGRLDLETLAALELLPRTRPPGFVPRPKFPPGDEPPVRGEWIRP